MTFASSNSNILPRRFPRDSLFFNSPLAAVKPKHRISFGFITLNCFFRYGMQVSISSGSGVRFPGGRHFTTFPIKTSSLSKFIALSISVRSCPALPTNGRPCLSSSAPGPSPITITSASGLPVPKTNLFLFW